MKLNIEALSGKKIDENSLPDRASELIDKIQKSELIDHVVKDGGALYIWAKVKDASPALIEYLQGPEDLIEFVKSVNFVVNKISKGKLGVGVIEIENGS